MLRDSPYLIGLILIIGAFIGIGTVWYVSDINEDSTVGTLNETVRATTISQVDLSSRVEPGVVYLNQIGEANMDSDNPDFETELLSNIAKLDLTNGSIVRIDYATAKETEELPASVHQYNIDEEDNVTWTTTTEGIASPIRPLDEGEAVEGVRVRIRREGHSGNVDDVMDADYWSYQSTVEVNRSDKIVSIMDEQIEPLD